MNVFNFEAMQAAAAAAPNTLDVFVAEWDGHVRLRKLSAADGIAFGQRQREQPEGEDSDGGPTNPEELAENYCWLLSLTIVDHEGQQSLNNEAGRKFLAGQPFAIINTLGMASMRLNGLTKAQATAREKN